MRKSTRVLLAARSASLVAEAGVVMAASARTDSECNIGSNTAGCGSTDLGLIHLALLVLPAVGLV